MVPLYAARVAVLCPADFVHIECPCGHIELMTAKMLETASVVLERKVADLGKRYREHNERGRALVLMKWIESASTR